MTRLRWLLATSLRGLASRTRAQPRLPAADGDRDRVGGRRPELPAQRRQLLRDRPAGRAAPDQHRADLRLPARGPGDRRPGDRDRPRRDRARVGHGVPRRSRDGVGPAGPDGVPRGVATGSGAPGVGPGGVHPRRPGREVSHRGGRDRRTEGRRRDLRLEARLPDRPAGVQAAVHGRRHLHAAPAGRWFLVRPTAADRTRSGAPHRDPFASRTLDHDPGRDRAHQQHLVRHRRPVSPRHPRPHPRGRGRGRDPGARTREGPGTWRPVAGADTRVRELPA